MNKFKTRSVRAYLFKSREFLHPDTRDLQGLTSFYGVLLGYEQRGEPYEINEGTGEFDLNGREIFVKDVVAVYSLDQRGRQIKELAKVRFCEGCYNVVNNKGLDVDIGSCNIDEKHYTIIVDDEYKFISLERL